jgi:hypothetical protein
MRLPADGVFGYELPQRSIGLWRECFAGRLGLAQADDTHSICPKAKHHYMQAVASPFHYQICL